MKPLKWNEYCKRMRPLLTKDAIFRDRLNREAELMFDEKYGLSMYKPLKWTPPKRKKQWQGGWYNFVHFTILQFLP